MRICLCLSGSSSYICSGICQLIDSVIRWAFPEGAGRRGVLMAGLTKAFMGLSSDSFICFGYLFPSAHRHIRYILSFRLVLECFSLLLYLFQYGWPTRENGQVCSRFTLYCNNLSFTVNPPPSECFFRFIAKAHGRWLIL